jgi:hypothetical protein
MGDEELSAVEQEIDAFMAWLGTAEHEKRWYIQHGIYRYDERLVPVDMSADRREPMDLDELPPEDCICDPSLD